MLTHLWGLYSVVTVACCEVYHLCCGLREVVALLFPSGAGGLLGVLRWVFCLPPTWDVTLPRQGTARGVEVPRRIGARLFAMLRFKGSAGSEGDRRRVFFFRGIPFATARRFGEPQVITTPASFCNRPLFSPTTRSFWGSSACIAPQPARLFVLDSPLLLSIPRLLAARWLHKGVAGGEDACLQLNVWAPESSNTEKKFPVLVFLHGGAYVFGSAHPSLQTGEVLARQNVVVVSAQYRLGALGYLKIPNRPSNLGLRDQLAALEWVKQNITSFGGDPANITLGGQSAGAMSTSTLMGVDRLYEKQLAHKFVLMSGVGHHCLCGADADAVYAMFERHAASLGVCSPGRLLDVIDRLPLSDLMRVQMAVELETIRDYRGFKANRLLPFGPWHTPEDDLLPANPIQLLKRRMLSGKPVLPVLAGTTDEEYTFFTRRTPASHPIDESLLPRRLAQWFSRPLHGKNATETAQRIDHVLDAYRNGSFVRRLHPPFTNWNALNGDWVFRLPLMHLASLYAEHAPKVPVYLYCFREGGVFSDLGATHIIDLHYFFGNLHTLPYFAGPFARRSEQLAVEVQERLAAFVADAAAPERDMGWRRFTNRSPAVEIFGGDFFRTPPFHARCLSPDKNELASWGNIMDLLIESTVE